jgi:hypothetical protein
MMHGPKNIKLLIRSFMNILKQVASATLLLCTYLPTPWSRVLLAACQEFPRIYETRKFITVLTSARHLSLF